MAATALAQPSWALDYVWNTSSGDWNNPANWNLLGVPGASDSAQLFDGSARVTVATSVGRLRMTGGGATVFGAGPLTVGTLEFTRGLLGGNSLTGYDSGSTTVTGAATFDGTQTQAIGRSHTLTLQGSTTWTAGTGTIGGSVFGGAVVNASGGSFIDQGAGSANGTKSLRDGTSGSSFVNQGTYVRTGLGTTRAHGFSSTGSLQVASGTFEMRDGGSLTGVTQLATGATLAVAASLTVPITLGGSIANQGVIRFASGFADVSSGTVLGGVVEVTDGAVNIQSTNTIQRLSMTGGGATVYGTGPLTVGTLEFTRGLLGGNSITGYDSGSTTVTGAATFDGTQTQAIGRSHTLTLQGSTTWTAGTGTIGGSVFGGAVVNASGGSFIDQGAGSANGTKSLRDGTSGSSFVNQGTYVRSGLGTTRASGLSNSGLVLLDAGQLAVDGSFSNTGTVRIATGATLESRSISFANAGLIQGAGTIKTFSVNDALDNAGTLDPGSAQATGVLTVDGDLRFAAGATLRIDLANGGLSDVLAVTSDVLWKGELAIWALPGLLLQGGEVFTIATYGQRLSASTFDSVSWHGLNSQQFTLSYGANDITLRVTAVPEPAAWSLFGAGLLAVVTRLRRRQQALQ